MRHYAWSVRCLLVVTLVPLILTGCGGGGGSRAPEPPGGGDSPAAAEIGTARFHVDVTTGQVTVAPITLAEGTVGPAAILTGSAVHFDSTVLYDQAGSTGLKVLDVSLTNRSGLAIGQQPDGTDVGLRVIFGSITPVTAASDIRNQVYVAKIASLTSPSGVAAARDGTLYVTGGNQVTKIRDGLVSVLAGNGSAGYAEGLGTTARFDNPHGIAENPADGSLIIADYTRHRIRRVDTSGTTSLVAGTGVAGGTNGLGSVATLSTPVGVAVDEERCDLRRRAGGQPHPPHHQRRR